MTTELTYLGWAVVLGMIHAVMTGQFNVMQNGWAYGLSPRDVKKPLTGMGGRVERAFSNYMQTFPFFLAAVFLAQAAQRHTGTTALGAQLYFWGRVAYVPLYAFGVPVARTVAYLAALTGIGLILSALI